MQKRNWKLRLWYISLFRRIYQKAVSRQNCYLTADGTSLCVNGTAIGGESKISKLYAGTTTYYAELNSSYAFVPSTVTYDFSLGSSSYPWKKAYITKLYLNGTEFTPQTIDTSKISYSSLIYASLNSSKQFIPSGTGYYLGSSTYPWQYAYITNLYLNGTKFDPASIGTDMSGKEFKMGGSSSYYMTANTSREFRPNTSSTTYPFYLGTTTYYWHYAYLGSNTVKIGSTASSKSVSLREPHSHVRRSALPRRIWGTLRQPLQTIWRYWTT